MPEILIIRHVACEGPGYLAQDPELTSLQVIFKEVDDEFP